MMTTHSSLSSPLNEAVASIVGDEGFTYWFVDGEQPNMNRAFMCREAAEAAARKIGKSQVVPLVEYRQYQTSMEDCLWAIERMLDMGRERGLGWEFHLFCRPVAGAEQWAASFHHPLYGHDRIRGSGEFASLAICRAVIALGCRMKLAEESPDIQAITWMVITHLADLPRLRELFARASEGALESSEYAEFAELVDAMHGQCAHPHQVLLHLDCLAEQVRSH